MILSAIAALFPTQAVKRNTGLGEVWGVEPYTRPDGDAVTRFLYNKLVLSMIIESGAGQLRDVYDGFDYTIFGF